MHRPLSALLLLATTGLALDAQPVRRAAGRVARAASSDSSRLSQAMRSRSADTGTAVPCAWAARDRYLPGCRTYLTSVNGDTGRYVVHVPRTYVASRATPVVFMLHGTSGNGPEFYDRSGWKELGDTATILTVFPSSWRHCIVDQRDGQQSRTTKWHVLPSEFTYCQGERPRDDIAFLGKIIDELQVRFAVDRARIYVVGFSNGGQMAGRVAVELSDRVAAVVSSSGFLPTMQQFTPRRLLPVMLQVGNRDDRFFASPAPMNVGTLFAGGFFRGVMATYVPTFQLDTTTFTTSGNPNSIVYTDGRGTSGDANNVFRFALVANMAHVYPNGTNHRVKGAELDWGWLRAYTLPGGEAGNAPPSRGRGRGRPGRRQPADSSAEGRVP